MHTSSMTVLMVASVFGGCVVGEEDDIGDHDLALAGKTTAMIKIVQHNIEKKPDVLQRVIAHAQNSGAHGIALQEVCPAEVAWLQANYGSQWSIGAVRGKKRAISGCDLPDGTHDYPHAVVIWTGGTGASTFAHEAMARPATAPGAMVCVNFDRARVPVHFCSAHLIAGDWRDPATNIDYDGKTLRLQQTTYIKQLARDQWFGGAKNHFGIIAGDLNGQPSSEPLDKLYDGALGGTGDFTEYNRNGGNRDGQVTAHPDDSAAKKIDYVFYSTNRAPLDGPAVNVTATASDHDMVTSSVQMHK